MDFLTEKQIVDLIVSSAEHSLLENETVNTFKTTVDQKLKILAFARMIQAWNQVGSLQNYARDEDWPDWPEVSYADFLYQTGKDDPVLWAKAQVVLYMTRDGLSEQEALQTVFSGHLRAKISELGLYGTRSESMYGICRRYYKNTRTRWAFTFEGGIFTVGKLKTVEEEGVRSPGIFGIGRVVVKKTVTNTWIEPVVLKSVGDRIIVSDGLLDQLRGALEFSESAVKIVGDVLALRATNTDLEVFITE